MEHLQLAYAWLGARVTVTKERMKGDAGEGPVSYIAVILLIALIAAAFVSTDLGGKISGYIGSAVDKVFTSGGGGGS